ncbi:small EDRK-rich factor [Malassezia restricta]|uniref:small EDRK-rich factor n=1 Tax=Malassezia restricta TaxID=76775 RepID=UPI000DD13C0E|nr:small EDRK-rich factor [Malassezia restricta]AXA48394.1 small EDRK-rich factor [Malassezia restricta]
MARGNAREIARAKNQKKQADMNKGKSNDSGLTLAQRRERDAAALRAKQEAAAAKKGAQKS